MTQRWAIGMGASSRAASADVVALIRASVDDLKPDALLATLDRRAEIAAQVAAELGLRLVLLSADVLAGARGVKTASERSAAETGSGSVAEAAALASLGPGARLVMERRTGNRCTCAMAVLP
jgi:cobalt-precorrin 5A hydrolase